MKLNLPNQRSSRGAGPSIGPLITVTEDRVFALGNSVFSYVFRVSAEGVLEHLYYGATLGAASDAPRHDRRVFQHVAINFDNQPNYNLNNICLEYPGAGRSDYRQSGLKVRNATGSGIVSLRYHSHRIVSEKPDLDDLPSSRGGDCETLIVTLVDEEFGLEIDLLYTVYRDYGVLARSARITNKGVGDVRLQDAASSVLDCPVGDYELLHLHGTWACEFNTERMRMPSGRFSINSTRGASSFAHHPFLALMEEGAGETHGAVFGTALVYSGNFKISAEKGEFGGVRVITSLSTPEFEWRLNPGETFQTPEALHVFSSGGLRRMSRFWHEFVRDKISPPAFRLKPRPTYLNSWESAYFDIDESKVLSLADCAKQVGVDMLVVDDGWFEGRTTNATSLGDWTGDKKRFPSGIPALAGLVREKGLKFGLWIEPEMISEASELYRAHPDWVLCAPGSTPSKARNQFILDLSRQEIADHVFNSVDALLSCGRIDYIKWDMNRPMSEVGSSAFPPEQQGEIAHRYMLGLYSVLRRLSDAYPDIIFENCASGGNRFDLGMLRYMPQAWISDMADPIGRLPIINGASLIYPLDVTSAYVPPSPNHQNGRATSIATRFLAGAFCAGRGLSLNADDIAADFDELSHWMTWARDTAPDFVGGEFTRIFFTDNEVCWQYSERSGARIYVVYFQILSGVNKPFARARLADVDPDSVYTLTETGERFRGDALMLSGVPLPYFPNRLDDDGLLYLEHGDFASCLLTFEKYKK